MATEYKVGYKKPPKHSQFKQGQSGNPHGRPKGAKNLKTDLLEELGEQIRVREGSRTRKISKQRAILKNLIVLTLKCDARATSTLVNLMLHVLNPQDPAADDQRPLTVDEKDALAVLKARLLQQSDAEAEGINAVAPNGKTK